MQYQNPREKDAVEPAQADLSQDNLFSCPEEEIVEENRAKKYFDEFVIKCIKNTFAAEFSTCT
uniref:Uncharacterized protein n=1 Tax=Romanomermis culicivorax TaxID=13658 RepID=A0A915JSR3_ROMCU